MTNRQRNFVAMALMAIAAASCNQNIREQTVTEMESIEKIFPRGKKITNYNFTGTVWLHMLVNSDTTYTTSIGNVTFEPGARSNWHSHPSGQILLVTNGTGCYQEKGKPVKKIRKGEVITCPPNVIHWHGASPDSSMTHLAINPNTQKGVVNWLDPVSDEEYKKP